MCDSSDHVYDNFEIATIGAFDAQHDGLRLEGFDPSHPAEPLRESARAAVRRVLQGIDALEDLVDLPDILMEHGEKPVPAATVAGAHVRT